MVLVLFSWWYTAGWAQQAARVGARVSGVLEMFSVGLLLRTLFAPFRQISAEQGTRGALNTQMRAMGDRLFSRIFGACIRTLFIIFGLIGALFAAVLGVVQLLVWPFIPLLPIFGIFAAALGVTL